MNTPDILSQLSQALKARTQAARPYVAELHFGESVFTGTLWRPNVVIASEQALPDDEFCDVTLASGNARARVAGRDAGTNVAVLQLEQTFAVTLPAATNAEAGTLALAFGADGNGGASVHQGIVTAVGSQWQSRAGGRIDARVELDLNLNHHQEGGPVFDTESGLLGISTNGARGGTLVIPAATVERVIDPLLASGRIARGWLGVALQPVAVPENLRAVAGQDSALMVMDAAKDGPAATAGVVVGDILLQIDGLPLTRMRALSDKLGTDSVGKQVEVKLIRAGAVLSVSLTVTARPPKSDSERACADWSDWRSALRAEIHSHAHAWRHAHRHGRHRHGC